MRIKKVKMVQMTQCNWRIETLSGSVMKADIMLGLQAEAEEYVRKYLTSFTDWSYEMVPLNNTNKGSK